MIALPVSKVNLTSATERLERLRSDERNFSWLAAKLLELSGINLATNPKNMGLMAARLIRLIERRGLNGYEDYIDLLKTHDAAIEHEFISALTTNTTEFFREDRHFEILSRLLGPYLDKKRAQGSSELRIWCAAASTGQEVYSIAMTILENQPTLGDWNLKILATDIDREVLDKASRGIYAATETAGIPPIFKQKYLQSSGRDGHKKYAISPAVSRLITFAPFNLMTDPYPFKHKFDIIFCRNVLIYFDRETSTQVTERMRAVMVDGGYLFVGHSEVGLVKPQSFATESSAVYRRV